MPPATNSPAKHSAAPERSLNQRMDALQRANQIRTRRAQLKRDLKGGRVSIQKLLLGDNHGRVRECQRLVVTSPCHRASAYLGQALKEIGAIKNVPQKLLRCIAQHDRRQLRTTQFLHGELQARVAKQARTAGTCYSLPSNQYRGHPTLPVVA